MDILASLASNSGSIMTSSGLTKSLLLLGPPGVGKTTLLRDISYTLADIFRKRVIVVDSSNEIGGDGDVPHECIGWRARRMQVPKKELQHRILTEAVQNHTPQVLIIDEIGTKAEVEAARKHSQAGVMLIGTAHGIELTTLLKNPELNGLIGGLHEVVVGDAAMRNARYSRRNRDENRDENAYDDTRKTKTERRGAPTFTTIIEVLGYDAYRVHMNTAESVDALLNGRQPQTQLRWKTQDGRFMAKFEGPTMKTSSKIPIHEPFTVASKPTEADWLTQLITLSSCLSRSQN
jgi:DNA polymerase III delta prime subunit